MYHQWFHLCRFQWKCSSLGGKALGRGLLSSPQCGLCSDVAPAVEPSQAPLSKAAALCTLSSCPVSCPFRAHTSLSDLNTDNGTYQRRKDQLEAMLLGHFLGFFFRQVIFLYCDFSPQIHFDILRSHITISSFLSDNYIYQSNFH